MKLLAQVLLLALLISACKEDGCDTLSGMCPGVTPPSNGQNGVFEAEIKVSHHGSAQSIYVDKAGTIWVGGFRHNKWISDQDVNPAPLILKFDAQGVLIDSTSFHFRVFEGTIAGLEEDGDDLLLSMWGAEVDTNIGRLDHQIARYRFNKNTKDLQKITEIQSERLLRFYPVLYGHTNEGAYVYASSPMEQRMSDGRSLLNMMRSVEDDADLLAIDRNGSVAWKYKMPEVDAVIATNRDPIGTNIVLGGKKERVDFWYSLAGLDDNGQEIWRTSYTGDSTRYRPKAVVASSSEIYVLGDDLKAGRLVLISHDKEGVVKRVTEISDKLPKQTLADLSYYHDYEVSDMLMTSTGKIALTWALNDNTQSRYSTELTIINSDGTIEKRIPVSPSYERVNILAMEEAVPGRIILAGSAGDYDGYLNSQNILLVGYDL